MDCEDYVYEFRYMHMHVCACISMHEATTKRATEKNAKNLKESKGVH